MFSSFDQSVSSFSLLSSTVLELDDHHYSQAQTRIDPAAAESSRWQAYLGALGMLAFQDWLSEQAQLPPSTELTSDGGAIRYLSLGDFRLCIITMEDCLADCVTLPAQLVQQPDWAAHFYLLLEVAEERAEVLFRGLLRYDRLCQWSSPAAPITLPLSAFEPDLSRLLHYVQYLAPSAMALPVSSVSAVPQSVTPSIAQSVTTAINNVQQLSQWLNQTVVEGWQTLELLMGQPQLAAATRGLANGVRLGKLINLNIDMGEVTVALVLSVTQEANEKINVLIQLLPTGRDLVLPSAITLSMVTLSGKVLQSVTSRYQNDYIQLKSFRGNVGQRFQVMIQLGEISLLENFEI